MQLPVRDWDNRETGSIELADGVFGGEVRRDLLTRVVNWQRAKKRGGHHKVKERSEVVVERLHAWAVGDVVAVSEASMGERDTTIVR